MDNRDFKRFAAVMATLSEAFDKEISDKKLEVYFAALKELDIKQVEWAAKWLMRNRTITGTFPLISEFFQALEHAQNGTVEDRAQLAWRKLVWAIENYGYYQSVQFDDPVIHAVVEALGGWLKISGDDPDWSEAELKWRQKDFIALYQALSKAAPAAKPYLPGLIELENPNHPPPPLIRITGTPGDSLRALPGVRPNELPPPDAAGVEWQLAANLLNSVANKLQ